MGLIARLKGIGASDRETSGKEREFESRKREAFTAFLNRHHEAQREFAERMAALEYEYFDVAHRRPPRSTEHASPHPHPPGPPPRAPHWLAHWRGGPGFSGGYFRNFYGRLRMMRPFHIVFNLALWSLLFIFGGFTVGIRIPILVLALLTSFGSFVELLFVTRVDSRILKPIEELEAAAARVAAGDFEVRVDPSQASEIGGLVMAFNDMAAALGRDQELAAQYERDRKDLVANISHDLKTPIASIQGYVEAMEDERLADPERRRRYLAVVKSNTAYMNRLIDDLFLFSLLDMRKLEFHFSDTRLGPYMRDLVEEFTLDLDELGCKLSYEEGIEEDAKARIDPRRFQQVLRNILDNAAKYGPASDLELRIAASTADGRLVVTIADNGPGIAEDRIGRIFERFYRIESERTKDVQSTGLGLAIAKELVEAHGGKLSASNREGGGALFRIELPLAAEAE